METEFISLFVLLFFGVNTALASPFMLQSIGSCDSFPNSLQLFCYKIENLWNNQVIATSDDNDNDKENSSVQLILGKETKNGRKKATVCSVDHCQICPVIKKCTKCKYGYFIQTDPVTNNISCVRKCFPGYKRRINPIGVAICDKIQDCSIKRCLTCIDSEVCSVCERGYYPQFNADSEKKICVKQCFVGYALSIDANGNKSCQKIPRPVGCSDLLCTICKRGFYMQPNKTAGHLCLRKCPKGYLRDRIRRLCVQWP